MSEHVAMVKEGRILQVHPDAVQDHRRLGWAVLQMPEAKDALAKAEETIAERDATIAELRVRIAELEGGEPDLEKMKAGELITYAAEHNLDIGGLVAQSGREKILAAVLAAKG